MSLLALFFGAIFVNNILLARFLGCCPFLGVSNKLETARGMGLAVIFVIVLASTMTWSAYTFILVPFARASAKPSHPG
jgi:electron transport complex protein RnfA